MITISPWNFPLAIFTGETIAALAAGNTVVAKPAEQTSLIAHYAVQLMHQAGIPAEALQLVLGAGDVGAALTQDPRIAGVIFTGSTEVAQLINRTLAQREDYPVLIAETGGQNAMIVDSTALPEQVVADVINSAFDSAGQRCSALRILCLQDSIADKTLAMIKGAMDELNVGNPVLLETDIGPVIDGEAQANLLAHIEKMKSVAKSYHEVKMQPETAERGTFVAPILFELNDLSELKREVFGPVLHVVRYRSEELDQLVEHINRTGYALTHGIHSRIDSRIAQIRSRIEAGNVYVNRNIVGAVVGVQPFGGHGLSGTGPKAGGPFYLQRLSSLKNWIAPTTEQGHAYEDVLYTIQDILAQLPLTQPEKRQIAETLGTARVFSLVYSGMALPSCTGETNTLTWRSPAAVWLYGGTLAQAIAALAEIGAIGSTVVVSPEHPLAAYANQLIGCLRVDDTPEQSADIDAVVALEALPIATKQALAARQGAIVRLIDARETLNTLQLYHEVSCSENTTAAGGNASLMAMGDK